MNANAEHGDTPPESQPGADTRGNGIPKAFQEIAAFREDVNMKRVGIGDKRKWLHGAMDDLTQSVNHLGANLKQLQQRLQDQEFHRLSFQINEFHTSLREYWQTEAEYCQQDNELGAAEFKLTRYERKVYDQLHVRPGDDPVPQRFNERLSLQSKTNSKHSLPELPYYPAGSMMSFEEDPFESMFGSVPIGSLPIPLQNPKKKPRLISGGSTGDAFGHGVVENEPENLDINSLFPLPLKALDVFPPLFLAGNEDKILQDLVSQFQGVPERVNRWLLHMLGSSDWETRRFYLHFRAEEDASNSPFQLDAQTWSYWVIQVWSQDKGIFNNPPPERVVLTLPYDLPAFQLTNRPSGYYSANLPSRKSDPLPDKSHKRDELPRWLNYVPQSQADIDRSDGYFGEHAAIGSIPDFDEKPRISIEETARVYYRNIFEDFESAPSEPIVDLPDFGKGDGEDSLEVGYNFLRGAGSFVGQSPLEPSESPIDLDKGILHGSQNSDAAFLANLYKRLPCEIPSETSPVRNEMHEQMAENQSDNVLSDNGLKAQSDSRASPPSDNIERPTMSNIAQQGESQSEEVEQTETSKGQREPTEDTQAPKKHGLEEGNLKSNADVPATQKAPAIAEAEHEGYAKRIFHRKSRSDTFARYA